MCSIKFDISKNGLQTCLSLSQLFGLPHGFLTDVSFTYPSFWFQEIPEDTSPFEVDNLKLHALPVLHGADYVSFGYGFGPPGSSNLGSQDTV